MFKKLITVLISDDNKPLDLIYNITYHNMI
jgi:hypothetical protein